MNAPTTPPPHRPLPRWLLDMIHEMARHSPAVVRCVRLSWIGLRYYERFERTESRVALKRARHLWRVRDELYLELDAIQAEEYLKLVRGTGMN